VTPATLVRMATPTDPRNAPQPRDTDPNALHAPWRHEYMEELSRRDQETKDAPPAPTDFLRAYWEVPGDDARHHVVARVGDGPTAGFLVLNKFPYANGHLLAALGDARPRLLDYDPAQRAALWRLTDLAVDLIERALRPQGVNVGVNQGVAAGAGLPGHLHVHVVPRWMGDVNFLAVVGRVRVIPSALEKMAERYREVWSQMEREGVV